ncbi:NifU family protein [Candidatus Bipolaricaulota bacterium]|nr:NifU family protein [Candidatus Bipolaricaulota bacterium]MBS3825725.1 NifU family protein [Candidatus Bipolaricaulota bacterium]MCF7891336.1 NifU family protein [Candidatus Bipolaricaulota bacterium]
MITEEEVEEALDEVRPSIQADGGNVILDEITEDNVVKVQLVGACAGCPMSTMTLKQGVEKVLEANIPEIKEVRAV